MLGRIQGVLQRNQNKYKTYVAYLKNRIHYEFVPFFDFMLVNAEWAKTLPHNVDCVVGIPRLGLISGAAASVFLGKPLATPSSVRNKKDIQGKQITFKTMRILLVDDSVTSGRTSMDAKRSILEKLKGAEIIIAAPYASTRMAGKIAYKKVVGDEMFFESDLAQHPRDNIAMDIDGVLCADPPAGLSGALLTNFYKNAEELFIPAYKVAFLATGRHEKHRAVTEGWLRRHNVEYGMLMMRNDEKSAIEVKANAIKSHRPFVFYESLIVEARELYEQTGCMVLCFENKYLYGGKNNAIEVVHE